MLVTVKLCTGNTLNMKQIQMENVKSYWQGDNDQKNPMNWDL